MCCVSSLAAYPLSCPVQGIHIDSNSRRIGIVAPSAHGSWDAIDRRERESERGDYCLEQLIFQARVLIIDLPTH